MVEEKKSVVRSEANIVKPEALVVKTARKVAKVEVETPVVKGEMKISSKPDFMTFLPESKAVKP